MLISYTTRMILRFRWLLFLTFYVTTASCSHTSPRPIENKVAEPPKSSLEDDAIRNVDFKNFAYPYEKSSPSGKWEPLTSPPTVKLVDGRCDLPDGDYLMFNSVTYGDLDGDGRDDAAVDLNYGTGGTQNWHYLYVFKQTERGFELLSRFASRSRADGGLVNVGIRFGELTLDLEDSERRQADCCSAGFERIIYRLEGRSFSEKGPRYKGTFRNHADAHLEQGADSVHASEANIVYTDGAGQEHSLTNAETDESPSLSFDKKSVVFVRKHKEVWAMNVDGSNQKKIFSCGAPDEKWMCESPQFSADGRFVYVIREAQQEEGGIWKIDMKSGKGSSLIENSSQFQVIRNGSKWGFLIANQRKQLRDRLGGEYARYPFYLFTSDGVNVRQVGDDEERLPDLEEKL
jgi:hypothetical protein